MGVVELFLQLLRYQVKRHIGYSLRLNVNKSVMLYILSRCFEVSSVRKSLDSYCTKSIYNVFIAISTVVFHFIGYI